MAAEINSSGDRTDTPALATARPAPNWDELPRLLGDECDGPHGGGHMWTVYAFDVAGRRSWYCKSCWIAAWKREQGLRWEA